MSDFSNSKRNLFLSIVGIAISCAGIALSVGSLVVAVRSLRLSLDEGEAARYHNRISLTPRLYFLPERTPQDPQVGLLLMNSGLGPAFIKNWTVSVDNKPVGTFSNGWSKALEELKLNEAEGIHYVSFFVLEAGKNDFIFSINQEQWKKLEPKNQQAFQDAMRRIKVVIDYDSVYNERQQCIFDGAKLWQLNG